MRSGINLAAALMLGGCALSPQSIDIAPRPDVPDGTSVPNANSITITVNDSRGDRRVGSRGGIYRDTAFIDTRRALIVLSPAKRNTDPKLPTMSAPCRALDQRFLTMPSVLSRAICTAAAALFVAAAPTVHAAEKSATATAKGPRTKDGKPDLNGIWQALNSANYDIEPHAARAAMAMVPGQFVQVTVQAGESTELPVVPASAILQDQQGVHALRLNARIGRCPRMPAIGRAVESREEPGKPAHSPHEHGSIRRGCQRNRPYAIAIDLRWRPCTPVVRRMVHHRIGHGNGHAVRDIR